MSSRGVVVVAVVWLVACGGGKTPTPPRPTNEAPTAGTAEPMPPPVEGTRELDARYEVLVGGRLVGEQRLFIDKRADGQRVFTAHQTGVTPLQIRVEAGEGHGVLLRREGPDGVMVARRDAGQLTITGTLRDGTTRTGSFPVEASSYLTGLTLAPDQLVYPELMKLEVGAAASLALAGVATDPELAVVPGTVKLTRRPDEQRSRAGTQVPVRVFDIALSLATFSGQGTLAIDAEGHPVEQTFGDELMRRIE